MERAGRGRYRPPPLSRLISAALVGWVLCVAVIFGWSRRAADGHAEAIVVLGAAQYDGRPSPVLRARLDHALARPAWGNSQFYAWKFSTALRAVPS